MLWGLSHAAGKAADQAARLKARELGFGPASQALAAAATHTVVGLVCTPLDATGVAAPFTATLHGVTQFRVTYTIAQRKARPAA